MRSETEQNLGEARAECRTFYPVLGEGERLKGAKAQRPLEFLLPRYFVATIIISSEFLEYGFLFQSEYALQNLKPAFLQRVMNSSLV